MNVLPADPTFGEILEFQFSGLMVVLGTLTFLAVSCITIGFCLRFLSGLRQSKTEDGGAAPVSQSGVGELPEETLAVIAAAVAETFEDYRIVNVRRMDSVDWNWSLQGRSRHHSSHKPR